MRLMLASQSSYKRQQLSQLGLTFETINPQYDENHNLNPNVEQLSVELAQEKALAGLSMHPDALIIGSDQTAVSSLGELLTKPDTKDEAIAQLKRSSGQKATFYSGICIAHQESVSAWSIPTTVYFRDLTDEEILRYIEKDSPLDCAGSFKVESLGISLFSRIETNDPSALIGLPLISLANALRAYGFQLP